MALVHNQLIAKRSHEPRGATETRKLNHIHRRKARNYVTEEMSQDFKNKSTDQCFCCKKEKHKLWNCPEFKMIKVKQGCDFVKKHKPSCGCLGKTHNIKDCKVSSRRSRLSFFSNMMLGEFETCSFLNNFCFHCFWTNFGHHNFMDIHSD